MGWSSTQSDTPVNIHSFWNYRDKLSIIDGIVLKGTCIIVPEILRPQILEQLNYAHLGIDKTHNMAKSTVYWPNIHTDIETMVKSCTTCQEMLPTKPANPLIPHPIPISTWYTLGAEDFYLDKKIYLCVVDYHSKFPLVKVLPDTSAHSLKEAFKDIISEHRFFWELVSDAGVNLTSDEFQKICTMLDIKCKITYSYHHSSNGWVENCIKLIIQTYKKCLQNNHDPRLSLLQIQTTPINHEQKLPAKLLGRKMHGLLPSLPNVSDNQIRDVLEHKQEHMKLNHDNKLSGRSEPEILPTGTQVMV